MSEQSILQVILNVLGPEIQQFFAQYFLCLTVSSVTKFLVDVKDFHATPTLHLKTGKTLITFYSLRYFGMANNAGPIHDRILKNQSSQSRRMMY